MQNRVRIDPEQIPAAEVRNLALSIIGLAEQISRDPEALREFEAWKAAGGHLKYRMREDKTA